MAAARDLLRRAPGRRRRARGRRQAADERAPEDGDLARRSSRTARPRTTSSSRTAPSRAIGAPHGRGADSGRRDDRDRHLAARQRVCLLGRHDPDVRRRRRSRTRSPNGTASASEALDRALAEIRPGVTGKALYDAACDIFEAAGYPTQRTKADGETLASGFFHSLGHGVGLEVHEAPLLGHGRTRAARRRRRPRGRARPLPRGLRRLPARGSRARDRGRRREADRLPVRARRREHDSDQSDRHPASSRSGATRRRREFAAQANAQPEIYDEDFEAFWEREGRERVTWFEPFTKLSSGSGRTRSGSSAASSTSPTTASTGTSRPGAATRIAFHWEGEPAGRPPRDHLRRPARAR